MTHFTRTPRSTLGVALDLWKWGFTGAVGAGVAWAFGILLGRVLLDHDISQTEGSAGFLYLEARAAALGLLVGSISAAVLLRPVVIAVLFWGPVFAATALLGATLSSVATHELQRFFPSQMSSSLGFAIAGFFAGLCGYGWLQLTGKQPVPASAEDEDTAARPPSEGRSSSPTTSRSENAAALFQSFLIIVALVSSLAAAELVANRCHPLEVFWGLFGISVTLALWNQEQRLRDLEAQHTRKRDP